MSSSARSIFLAHVETLEDGSLDASSILSKRCFDEWVRTRRKPPDNAPQGFRNALKTVLVGSHRVLPFPADVEAALLPHLREKRRWPCFEGTGVNIGVRGWKSLRCFHEAKGHGAKGHGARGHGAKGHEAKGHEAKGHKTGTASTTTRAPASASAPAVGVGPPIAGLSLETEEACMEVDEAVTATEESDWSRSSRKRPERDFASAVRNVSSALNVVPRQVAKAALVLDALAKEKVTDRTLEGLSAASAAGFENHATVAPHLVLPATEARFDELLARMDVRLQNDFIVCPAALSHFVPMQPVYGMQTLYRNDFGLAVCTSCEAGAKDLFGAKVLGRPLSLSEVPVYNAFMMAKFLELCVPTRIFSGEVVWGHSILKREAAPDCVVRYNQKLLRYTAEGFAVIGMQVQDVSALFPLAIQAKSTFRELQNWDTNQPLLNVPLLL